MILSVVAAVVEFVPVVILSDTFELLLHLVHKDKHSFHPFFPLLLFCALSSCSENGVLDAS